MSEIAANADIEPIPVPASLAWQATGAWLGGTVYAVALADQNGITQGLAATRAGIYAWEQGLGQGQGDVRAVINGLADPRVIAVSFATGTDPHARIALAATETGRLYRAGDTTYAWREVTAWAGLGLATVLAPSPTFAQDGTLLVGTPTGIFRTLDGGDHWEGANFGLLEQEILCLVVAPDFVDSQLLWAGTANGGLYRSRNGGRAWRESGLGLPDAPVQTLAVSPYFAQDRTLYAGMEERGVYRSTDGGENWQLYGLNGTSINALVCRGDGTLLAGTAEGLYQRVNSHDSAQGDWQLLTAPLQDILALAADGAGGLAVATFQQGLALSHDDGATWTQPPLALHAPPVLVTVDDDHLLALDADGAIAHSADGGQTWMPLPLEVAAVNGIAASPGAADAPSYAAATDAGLYRWDGEWVRVADKAALAVALSPAYATDRTGVSVGEDGTLTLTTDAGTSWQAVTVPWGSHAVLQVQFAAAPGNPALAVLTGQLAESGHYQINLWQSNDLGATWAGLAELTTGVPAVLLAWPHDPAQHAIFLATQHRIVKIYGVTEGEALDVHQHFFDEAVRVTALATAQDYAENNTLWAASSGGVYQSVDGGGSWSLVSALPAGLPIIALQPVGKRLRAISLGGQLWETDLTSFDPTDPPQRAGN